MTRRFGTTSVVGVFVIWCVCEATLFGGSKLALPLRLADNGQYVVGADGTPFFMNGESAWSLIANATREEVELYLDDRHQKGINLVLVNLLERKFSRHAPANAYGQLPFDRPGDFSVPNESYFAHADWVVEQARRREIVVMLAPLYLGWQCRSEGWCEEIKASTPATMKAFGRYVGARYRRFPNIVWIVGGDTDPLGIRGQVSSLGLIRRAAMRMSGMEPVTERNDVAGLVRAFVNGLKEMDAAHLITAHNAPEQAAIDPWPGESWIDLNNLYTVQLAYHGALRQYNRRPFRPFFLVETDYENYNHSTPLSIRRQAYWTVLSGGTVGHIFGNCQIWGFSNGFCKEPWQLQLNSEGSRTLPLVGRLFSSRAFHKLIPDQQHKVLIGGFQRGGNYAAAARASDGSSIIVYMPTRRRIVVDLSSLSGARAKAWWFNPRDGEASFIGVYDSGRQVLFVAPDQNDWVLVVDSARLNLPPPGASEPDRRL